jgi:hypothetical protein
MRLEKAINGMANTSSYCAVQIDSPKEQVCEFGIGAGSRWNSTCRSWLNGKYLYSLQAHFGFKKNARRAVGVLKKGSNIVLVRLDEPNNKGGVILTYRAEGITVKVPDGVK